MAKIRFGRLKIKIKTPSAKLSDIRGLKFGRLTAVVRAPSTKSGAAQWACTCSCGGEPVIVRGDSLRSGRTLSCGCLVVEARQARAMAAPKAERKPRQRRPTPQRFVYTDPDIAKHVAGMIGSSRNWHRYRYVMDVAAEEWPGEELVPEPKRRA